MYNSSSPTSFIMGLRLLHAHPLPLPSCTLLLFLMPSLLLLSAYTSVPNTTSPFLFLMPSYCFCLLILHLVPVLLALHVIPAVAFILSLISHVCLLFLCFLALSFLYKCTGFHSEMLVLIQGMIMVQTCLLPIFLNTYTTLYSYGIYKITCSQFNSISL